MDSRYWIIFVSALAGLVIIVLILMVDRSRRRNDSLAEELSEIRDVEQELSAYKAELIVLRDRLTEQLTVGVLDSGLAEQCAAAYGQIMTGSLLLDSLLTQKLALCRERGVEFDCSIPQVPKQIGDRDLVGLFANLLDNALEAALRFSGEKGQTGWIRAESKQMGRQWMLAVENSKREAEKPLENGLRTTKTGGGDHGLGSGIIDHVVKKNKGIIRRTDEGSVFRVLVTMPMEEVFDERTDHR